MDDFNRMFNEYISKLNKKKLTHYTLNNEKFLSFLYKNYFNEDKETLDFWINNFVRTPIGLFHVVYDPNDKLAHYFIVTNPNTKGTETIVFIIKYYPKVIITDNQCDYITYIQLVELNYFYKNTELLKLGLDLFVEGLDKTKDILIGDRHGNQQLVSNLRLLRKYLIVHSFKGELHITSKIDDNYVKRITRV